MAFRQKFACLQIEELFYNIIHNDTEAAIKLTEFMKVRDNVNQKVNSPESPITQTCLHAACHKGNLRLVKRLLDIGADPDLTDSYQSTPLHNAAAEGNLEVVKLLVEYKASPYKLKGEKDALGMARLYGNKKVVDFLEQFEPGRRLVYSGRDQYDYQSIGIMSDEEVHEFSYTEEAQLPQEEAIPVQDIHEDESQSQQSAPDNTSEAVGLKEKVQQLIKEIEQLKLNQSLEVSAKETPARGEVLKERIRRKFEHIVQNVCGGDHLDYLFSRNIISVEDYEKLQNKHGQREKTRALMLMLLGRPADRWVSEFMKSLANNQATSELAKELRK